MTPVLAHIAHWYHALLYLAPLAVVGLGLWWAGRGEDDEDADELPGEDAGHDGTTVGATRA